jgi:RnfABCDGE-type electron transport complex G subunit
MPKKFWFIFAGALLFSVVYHLFLRPPDTSQVLEASYCKEVLPSATEFSGKDPGTNTYTGYRVEGSKKTPIGIVFNTSNAPHEIYGFTDKIDMLVGVSNSGVVQGVKVIRHKETPGFFKKILSSKFFTQFQGKKLEKPLVGNKDVDTITGATVSSSAMIDTVNAAAAHYVTQVLKLPNAKFPPLEQKGLFTRERLREHRDTLATLGIIIFLGVLAYFLASEILWILQAILGVYFLGFHFQSFLSILNLLTAAFCSFHVLTRDIVVLTLALVFFCFVLVIPRFFCGYVCPWGALTRLIYKVSQRNWKLHDDLRQVKYYILAVVVVVFAITLTQEYVDIEPFIVLFNKTFTIYNAIYIAVFLTLAIFFAHFWCNYFCPLGALEGILSRLSLRKKYIDESCAHCEQCLKVCPHNAIRKRADNTVFIDPSECFSCQECIRKCPKHSIKN